MFVKITSLAQKSSYSQNYLFSTQNFFIKFVGRAKKINNVMIGNHSKNTITKFQPIHRHTLVDTFE